MVHAFDKLYEVPHFPQKLEIYIAVQEAEGPPVSLPPRNGSKAIPPPQPEVVLAFNQSFVRHTDHNVEHDKS